MTHSRFSPKDRSPFRRLCLRIRDNVYIFLRLDTIHRLWCIPLESKTFSFFSPIKRIIRGVSFVPTPKLSSTKGKVLFHDGCAGLVDFLLFKIMGNACRTSVNVSSVLCSTHVIRRRNEKDARRSTKNVYPGHHRWMGLGVKFSEKTIFLP